MADEKLPTIAPDTLETVTGGTTSDDDITNALKGITDSLASLKKQNTGGSWMNELLPFMMLMNMQGGYMVRFGGGGGGCGRCGHSPCSCGHGGCF